MIVYYKRCPSCGEETITKELPIDSNCSVCGKDISETRLIQDEIAEIISEKLPPLETRKETMT